jgi:hypothetical protein
MLHIVQVVLTGSAEPPQVFLDEAKAHAAYVAVARKYWATSYATYCERNGVDGDSFSSAQAFVASFDLADRSRIHYWNITPEGAGADVSQLLPGVAALVERREQIQRLVQEVEQASGIVREGLTELLGFVAGVTGEESCAPVRPSASEDRDTPGRFTPAEFPAGEPVAEAADATPQHDDAYYKSKEWKSYVESIMNMCGGNRSEYHLFSRYDWRQAVYSNETPFEYWDWVAATIDDHIERAQKAGYAVVDDAEKPGHYRFRTPDGVVSDISSEAEGEAWCRAGLHLKGK